MNHMKTQNTNCIIKIIILLKSEYSLTNFLSLFLCLFSFFATSQHNHTGLHHWEIPSKNPDRIILTFHGDPSTSRAVTWRTDTNIRNGVAQIAVAGENSNFKSNSSTYKAITETFNLGLYKSNDSLTVNYHSVVFKDLKPDQWL